MKLGAAVAAALLLSACAQDKILHVAAGTGIGVIGDEIYDGAGCPLAITAGVVRELTGGTGFSTLDLLATSVYCLKHLLPDIPDPTSDLSGNPAQD